jgi:PmbA protein
MSDFDLDHILKKLKEKGFDDYALELFSSQTEQVRFSGNSEDLYNNWNQTTLVIFASRKQRVVSTTVRDPASLDSSIQLLWDLSGKIPNNPAFQGINPDKQKRYGNRKLKGQDYDLQDFATTLINSALESGAERTAGIVYNRKHNITVKTEYNQCSYTTGGLEAVIRSFKGNSSGQEARHFGLSTKVDSSMIAEIGRESSEPLNHNNTPISIEPGKFDVIMSPYVIGNLISNSSDFLSYYSVESSLSCFADSLNKDVSSKEFTLVDDPLDSSGVGFRACDDEATATRKNTLIENGVLKGFMHSYSTSRHAQTATTGNAGIITPHAWQLKILPGKKSIEEIMLEMDEGLLINNCWYTRYQDYRNAVFSTVPRDGVFYVKNGEIQGLVSGIRISDSIPNVLRNVADISRETKNVKWWEEISASSMPYVLSKKIGISRAF